MTDPSQGDWEKLFREVQTLQRRSNHPNIIPLLASYTLDTDESGHYVKTLHLLFPLADMDLADWMTKPQIPSNVARLSMQDRQIYLYRFIYALISGITYLHKDVDGIATAHHDLKPRNILVVNDKLKIADFGHSHLRPILEGSATEGVAGLGTYEYQPPEYWNQDGSRAQIKHGRPFDVWAVGCIVIELATLVVHDWQSEMVNTFRNERKANPNRDRKSPESVQDGSEYSFHNNRVVVEGWVLRLKNCGGSQQLNEVLNIAVGMLAPSPRHRPYMWEIQMDLYETLKPYDTSIPNLEGDLCVPPVSRRGEMQIVSEGKSDSLMFETVVGMETPLHRAARKNSRSRTIRLWELGWPLSQPGLNRETPRDIINRSDHLEMRELESMVTSMSKAARGGNVGDLKKLISRGLSPLMVDANGCSALYEAVVSFQVSVVEYILNGEPNMLLTLWDNTVDQLPSHAAARISFVAKQLPLHAAARIGFVKALELMLEHVPDINFYQNGENEVLYDAARGGHTDAVKLLLKNKAKVLPSKSRSSGGAGTPVHAALSHVEDNKACEIVKLLLQADSSHECMEYKDGWGLTPLLTAAFVGNAQCFGILLQHGASVHASYAGGSLLHIIAERGRYDILRQCIESFSLEELEDRGFVTTPLQRAQESKHKEVAKLLSSHIRQVRRSAGNKSGVLGSLRNGLDSLKRL